MMNLKGYGRKWSWSNLKCYPGVCLKELSQDKWPPDGNLN
jgi:hypothetical protein